MINILKASDEAIFARRNAALEQERTIRENELDTEVAVESKKRVIRKTQMEAEASVPRKKAELRQADMEADITLTDGQTLYAVNDLFIGPRTHTSARYEIRLGDRREVQSSSVPTRPWSSFTMTSWIR